MSDKFEHKPGRGSLFKNDRREKETQPEYKGSMKDPEGREMWVSAWVEESKYGKYFSLSVQYKDDVDKKGMQQARQAAEPAQGGFIDEDLPFAPAGKGEFA